MPKIPLIERNVGIPGLNLPRTTAADFGGEFGAALTGLGGTLQQISDENRKQQDAIDFARLSGEHDAAIDDLAEQVKSEPDFQKREALFQSEAMKVREQFLKAAPTPGVKKGLTIHQAKTLPNKILAFRRQNQKDWNSSKLADLDALEDVLSDRVISSKDPEEATRIQNTFGGLVQGLSMGPYAAMDAEQAEKRRQSFNQKVTGKRAQKMIAENAAGFLRAADEGEFSGLTEDQVLKYREEARKRMDQDDRNEQKVFNQVKEIVTNRYQAAANAGAIPGSDMREMLSGQNPYISASEARTLNEINSNPVTGGGGTSVGAIATEYYLSPRSLPHINATRAKLRALQAQLGRPDPAINKLANELQSDQTTMENQGISIQANEIQRQNRAINDLKITYEAWVDTNPFMKKIVGNMAERDKARIADTYKKQGPEAAKALTESLIKNGTEKKTAIETKHGPALNW